MKTFSYGLMILALCNCSILPEPEPTAVHDFGYQYPSSGKSKSVQPQVTVEAPEWLTDTRIRYRLLYATPSQVRFYTLDKWIAPPPELFGQLLLSNNAQWPYPVTIRLQVFEQQFEAPGQAKAIMQFTAIAGSKQNGIFKQRDFQLQQPSVIPDAKGAVTGLSLLAKQAADKIQGWLLEAD